MFRAPVSARRIRAYQPALRRYASIDVSSFRGKHLDNMFFLSQDEMRAIMRISAALKAHLRDGKRTYRPLVGPNASRAVSFKTDAAFPYTTATYCGTCAGWQEYVDDFPEAQHPYARVGGIRLRAAWRARPLPQ